MAFPQILSYITMWMDIEDDNPKTQQRKDVRSKSIA